MILSRSALLLAIAVLAACGSTAAPAPTPTIAAAATPSLGPVASGNVRWEVATGSKAIVRVNEQLANITSPSDAVLTSDKVTGRFELRPDGTFTQESKITVDLTALSSDQRLRDDYVQSESLETRRFPMADFVPVRVIGLTLPLPASGDLTFRLEGKMTIHGVSKDVTFAVTAKRADADLTANAKADPSWKFGDFGMPQPRSASVLSVKDDIRLEIELVAKETR